MFLLNHVVEGVIFLLCHVEGRTVLLGIMFLLNLVEGRTMFLGIMFSLTKLKEF